MMMMMFFFMSGNQNYPPPMVVVGPDGELQMRQTELALMRQYVDDYKGFLNGTGNWTEVRGLSFILIL